MNLDGNSDEPKAASFKVVDRRRFTASGEVKPGGQSALSEERRRLVPKLEAILPQAQGAPAAASGAEAVAHAPQRTALSPAAPQRPPVQRRSQVDFMAFVASLATNAMGALGLMPEGQHAGMPPNPHLAREYIEIIFMLEERTAGNLTDDEAASLRQLLSDLRLQYVEATRPAQGQAPNPT